MVVLHTAISSSLRVAEAATTRRLVLVALPAVSVLKHAAVKWDSIQRAVRIAPGASAEIEHGLLAERPHPERAHHPTDPVGAATLRR